MNAASRSNCNDSEKLHAAAGCASASNAAATALEAAPAPTAPTAPATGAAANADDPGAPEDVEETDLAALLLPGGSFPTNVAFFGLAFSRAALGAWVKQPSPCCAAAAAAGALNAAAGIHRKDTDALRCEHALEVRASGLVLLSSVQVRLDYLLCCALGWTVVWMCQTQHGASNSL